MSKSLIALDKLHYDILSMGDSSRLNEISDSLGALKSNGFVVDDKLDENGALRYAYQQSKVSTDEIEFVVAPTMNCNFKCVYCFETHRKGSMSGKVQTEVMSFIKRKIEELGPNKVRFIWFGGEPLLCADIIAMISKKLKEFLLERTIELDMIAITNGYFATSENIRLLASNGVNHFQITIDGAKETHDRKVM